MSTEGVKPGWTSLTLIALFIALFLLVGFLSTALVIQRQLPDLVMWRVTIVLVVILVVALVINWRFKTETQA